MITRLVKMHFASEHVAAFQQIFAERKATIKAFEGCHHVALWQDVHQPEVFFTYSIWESEAHLNHYRFSAFFKETWGLTKALFAERAMAWSLGEIED